MIDETLTLGRAEQRIGDIVQKSTNILYPESPITIHWKTILALRDMLINEKLIKAEIVNGKVSYEIVSGLEEEKEKKAKKAVCQLFLAQKYLDQKFEKMVHSNLQKEMNFLPDFSDSVFEAVINAIEHGTSFCNESDVILETKIGEKGILATISQNTPGIKPKKIKNILQLKKNNPYWEKKLITSKETGLRGAGLTRFANEKMPFVGFKYWSETSPQFKVIILETRKQFKKIKFEI